MSIIENPRQQIVGKRFTYTEAVKQEKYLRGIERTGDSLNYRWVQINSNGTKTPVAGTEL